MTPIHHTYLELADKFIIEHDKDGKWSPFDSLEISAIRLFAEWLSKQQMVRPEWDEIVGKIITSNPPVMVINCNCRMMVKDLGELRDHWQRGHFDHQVIISHVNPNCKDATRCKPHGETGSVEYEIDKTFYHNASFCECDCHTKGTPQPDCTKCYPHKEVQ